MEQSSPVTRWSGWDFANGRGIATNRFSMARSDFCEAAGCTSGVKVACDQAHADPVQLPTSGDDIPQYMQNVIAACRADVKDRLPAWKLLELFPDETMPQCRGDLPSTTFLDRNTRLSMGDHFSRTLKFSQASSAVGTYPHQFTRLEDVKAVWDCFVSCDICATVVGEHWYHCNACSGGDFDIYVRCFDKGLHCSSSSHYLNEYTDGIKDERYYSSVTEDGRRNVVVLG